MRYAGKRQIVRGYPNENAVTSTRVYELVRLESTGTRIVYNIEERTGFVAISRNVSWALVPSCFLAGPCFENALNTKLLEGRSSGCNSEGRAMKTSTLSSSDMIKQEVSQGEHRTRRRMARVTEDEAGFRVDRWNSFNVYVSPRRDSFYVKHGYRRKNCVEERASDQAFRFFLKSLYRTWLVIARFEACSVGTTNRSAEVRVDSRVKVNRERERVRRTCDESTNGRTRRVTAATAVN